MSLIQQCFKIIGRIWESSGGVSSKLGVKVFLVRAGIQAEEQRVSGKKHHDLHKAITQKLQCSFGQPVSHQNFLI